MAIALLCVEVACFALWVVVLKIVGRLSRSRERRLERPEAAAPARPALPEAVPPAWKPSPGPVGIVSRFDLLQGLSSDQVDDVLALGRRRFADPGEQLAPRSDSVFLLLEGDVELYVSATFEGTKQHVRIERARPGEMLGWMSLVPSSPWQRSARVRSRSTVLEFPRAALLDLLAAKPPLAAAVHSNLAARASAELYGLWLVHLQREFARTSGPQTSAA